jgi:hypothetical protein
MEDKELKLVVSQKADPLIKALEGAGFTAKLWTFGGGYSSPPGGHIDIRSSAQEHWGCQLRFKCSSRTGDLERITVQARPARTTTVKYSEKAIPGILERVKTSVAAYVAEGIQRKKEYDHAYTWYLQALRDTKDLAMPECLIPARHLASDNASLRFERLHRGMNLSSVGPVGRYFPNIDTGDLVAACGGEGLTINQLKHLVNCLNELPNVK